MLSHRLAILSALTAIAISGIASALAPAAECERESGGTHFALCFNEPLTLVEGTFKLHINNDPTTPTKEIILKGSEVEIKCPEILLQLGATLSASKTISLGIRSAGIVLHFVKCKAPTPPNCALENELVITTTLDGVPPSPAADKLTLYLPETGVTFAEVKIISSGGTCLIAGTQKVTALNSKEGEGPLCKAPNGETTSVLHLTECTGTTALTHLRYGGKEIEFKGNFSALLEGGTTKNGQSS